MQAFRLIYRSIGCNIPRYSLQQQQSLQSNLQKRRERGRNRRGSLSRTRGGGNHFTTYFSLRLIFIFLPVWKEKGVGARWSGTRVRVATNPLPSSSSSSSKVYPGIDRRVEGKKKERRGEIKEERGGSINRRRTYTWKSGAALSRLGEYRSSVRWPRGIENTRGKRVARERMRGGGKGKERRIGKGKGEEIYRGREKKHGPTVEDLIDRLAAPAQYPWKAQRANVIAMEVMNKVNNHAYNPRWNTFYRVCKLAESRIRGWILTSDRNEWFGSNGISWKIRIRIPARMKYRPAVQAKNFFWYTSYKSRSGQMENGTNLWKNRWTK